MPDQFDTKHWRARADEVRVAAEDSKDLTAKAIMLQIANDFDRLLEHLTRKAPKGPD